MAQWSFTSGASSNCAPGCRRWIGTTRACERAAPRMRRIEYPAPIKALVAELKRMPGIGTRSAERIALWMIQSRDARPAEISRVISEV
ncbi:MAG TPA: hypothetical protein VF614_11740, partial [Chthoniobacteraceae bacterium]